VGAYWGYCIGRGTATAFSAVLAGGEERDAHARTHAAWHAHGKGRMRTHGARARGGTGAVGAARCPPPPRMRARMQRRWHPDMRDCFNKRG
jgi:hypothetical protein